MHPVKEQLKKKYEVKFEIVKYMEKNKNKNTSPCISHSLKRQTLLVLTLMSFQLVPLVEFLFTALMITLKKQQN